VKLAMSLKYFKSGSFLMDVILFLCTFSLSILFGWIIFNAITKHLILESLFIAVFLEIIFRFFLKKGKSADN